MPEPRQTLRTFAAVKPWNDDYTDASAVRVVTDQRAYHPPSAGHQIRNPSQPSARRGRRMCKRLVFRNGSAGARSARSARRKGSRSHRVEIEVPESACPISGVSSPSSTLPGISSPAGRKRVSASTDCWKMDSRRLSCSRIAFAAASISLNVFGLDRRGMRDHRTRLPIDLQHRAAAGTGHFEIGRLLRHLSE